MVLSKIGISRFFRDFLRKLFVLVVCLLMVNRFRGIFAVTGIHGPVRGQLGPGSVVSWPEIFPVLVQTR